MHAWDGPWPLEIRRRLDRLATVEHNAREEGYDHVADECDRMFLLILSEHDLTCNPRRARRQGDGG